MKYLILPWPENCFLTDIITQMARDSNPNANPTVEATERILKTGFKRTIK